MFMYKIIQKEKEPMSKGLCIALIIASTAFAFATSEVQTYRIMKHINRSQGCKQ